MAAPRPIPTRSLTVQQLGEMRYERMLRDLQSTLATQVEAGEITDTEANEWLLYKQEQWKGECNG